MTAQITTLIDRLDSFETVGAKIAVILAEETLEQQALATAGGEDPDLWKLRVFLERANPWEQFQNDPVDRSPIVNVWYDSSDFDKAASDTFSNQKATGVYNLDCYGYAKSADNPAGGYYPGDREAALVLHRALRLVRSILMASPYKNLDLDGVVWDRWVQSATVFQPQLDKAPIPNIIAARLALHVGFSEFAPQFEPVDLESVFVEVTEDSEVVIQASYPATP